MKKILLITLTLFLSGMAFGQSAEEAVNLLEDANGFGIRAAGLGNAYVGVADDYSAIYWNPAGLAQMHQGQFYGSIYSSNYQNAATYLGNTNDDKRSFTKLNSVGLVFPFPVVRGSLVMALGYQKFKDLDYFSEYTGFNTQSNNLGFDISNDLGDYGVLEFDRDIQQKNTTNSDGNLSQWSFGMAIDLSPNFSAGLSLNLIGGGSEYESTYSQDDVNAANSYDIYDENGQKIEEFYYNYYDVHQRISSDYSGFEAKLGGLFRLTDNIRFGGAITFPMTVNVEEDWSTDDELSYDIVDNNGANEFVEAYELGSGVFDYKIKVPFKFDFGASIEQKWFLLTAAANYTDWSQLKYERPGDRPSDEYIDLMAENEYFRSDFQAVLSYSAGAELRLLNNRLQLRGGYRLVPTAFKNVDSKYDKTYYSGGLGLRVDRSTLIEFSYTYGQWQRDKFYNYDWSADHPMETSEKYTLQRALVGVRLFF